MPLHPVQFVRHPVRRLIPECIKQVSEPISTEHGKRNRCPSLLKVNLRLTHRKFVHDKKNPVNPDDVRVPPYYPDHPLTRRDWADYLESIQVLDKQVSRVLKWLEEEEIEDDTIVFYFGDHGRPHLWAK